MARSSGRRWRYWPQANGGNATCDYCGARWPRAELRRDGAGLLVCPDEGSGADRVTLDERNAANAVWPQRHGWVDGFPHQDIVPGPNRIFGDDLLFWHRSPPIPQENVSEVPSLLDGGKPFLKPASTLGGGRPQVIANAINGRAALFGGMLQAPDQRLPGFSKGEYFSLFMVLSATRTSRGLSTQDQIAQQVGINVSSGGNAALTTLYNNTGIGISIYKPSTVAFTGTNTGLGSVGSWKRLVAVFGVEVTSTLLVGSITTEGDSCIEFSEQVVTSSLAAQFYGCWMRFRTYQIAEWGWVRGNALMQQDPFDHYIASAYGEELLT